MGLLGRIDCDRGTGWSAVRATLKFACIMFFIIICIINQRAHQGTPRSFSVADVYQ